MNKSTAQSDTKNNLLVKKQGESEKTEMKFYATGNYITGGTASTSANIVVSPSPSPGPPPESKRQIQLAILTHIQAIRALGRTEINTQDIADALCISVQVVNDTLEVLKKQGVRRR